MGSVYRAEHVSLGRVVAIKVMHKRFEDDERSLKRFLNEARAANRICSPHVLQVTDIARDPTEGCYFVMELLEGPTLEDVIKKDAPLEPERAVDITLQLCDALGAAHAAGVIHRDVKPANVILVRGRNGEETVKLIDFGVAKLIDPEERQTRERLTEDGMVVGTPNYMPLEQATGEPATPRLDVYALGVVLFEMVTGALPHIAEDFQALLMKVASAQAPKASSLNPAVPAELDAIIDTCLSAHPELRPAGMEELETRLRAFVNQSRTRPRWLVPASACVLAAVSMVGVSALLAHESTGVAEPLREEPASPQVIADAVTPAASGRQIALRNTSGVPDDRSPGTLISRRTEPAEDVATPAEVVEVKPSVPRTREEQPRSRKKQRAKTQRRAARKPPRQRRPRAPQQREHLVRETRDQSAKVMVIDQTFLLDPFAGEE